MFAWDARSTDSIGARLLIAIRPGRVDVAVSGAEGVEGDGFGNICGPIEIDLGMYRQSLPQKCGGLIKGERGIAGCSFRADELAGWQCDAIRVDLGFRNGGRGHGTYV